MIKAPGLAISPDLDPLPPAAVTQKFACLGISGSGKTYGAGKFTETLLDAGAQVVVVDTIGNWGQGLRLAADGKRPGIAIPILGGEHGDVPLDAEHGELAAATVVDTLSPLVLDVSDFTKGELCRFVKDFATELLTLKKRQKSPVMVVWEECQDIVPQVVRGEKAQMVGAVEALIKKGRNYGVGTMLISQRAAAVNKDVLNQIETLFAFRQNSKHDRLAVRDWIVSQAIDVENLSEQLPTLKTGECFCWSPSWLGVLKKIKFSKKRTFDASRTPDATDYVKPGVLAPVDLEAFKERMKDAIDSAAANDPAVLHKHIFELQEALVAATTKVAEPPEPERIEVPVFDEEAVRLLTEEVLGELGAARIKIDRVLATYLVGMREHVAAVRTTTAQSAAEVFHYATKPPKALLKEVAKPGPATAGIQKATNGAGAKLPTQERLILTALAQQHPKQLTRERLALMVGCHRNTKTFVNALGALRGRGAVDELTITDVGLRELGPFERLPTGRALIDWWCQHKLHGKEVQIIRAIQAGSNATREALAEAVGCHRNTKTFVNGLGRLRGLGIVDDLQLAKGFS